MKITSLTESNTPSSSTSNTTNSAPKFGRSDEFLEETEETVEESTTAGSVASVASPVGKVQSRGSMLKGIKTSDKYPNSKAVKEGKNSELDSLYDQYDELDYDGNSESDKEKMRHIQQKIKDLKAKEKKVNESQINEVDPRNFDSDVDYYAARNAPAKPRYRGTSSPGVNQDDEAYFREIFRKKRLAAQQQERNADHDRLATGTNEAVDEGEEFGSFAELKDWREWNVTILNNFYAGKYADYSARYYSVVAGSPEEARQVVLDNPDYVLKDLLARKLQNGKKVLPRSSALPIEDKRVRAAKPGSLTTVGFKQMLTPQGPMLLKFASGKIIAREEPLDVEEGMFGFGSSSKPAQQQKPLDYNAVRQMSQQSGPQRKVYAHPEEYRKVHGEFDESSFDYTMKDLGNDYAGFPSNHSMKHKFLAKIKPEKRQLYKDKMNNTHEWDALFALFKVAKARGDIIEQGVAEADASTSSFRRGNTHRAAVNAMSPEERKAHEEKRAEQQRKRDDARMERERQRNAAKKGVAEEQVNEKSKSQAQFRTMAAVANNPKFAKKVGISQKVGKEFHKADKKQDYKDLPKEVDEGFSDMMAKERKKRLAAAEKKKQERLAKEKENKKNKEQGVAEMDGNGSGRDGSNRKRIGSYGSRDRDITGPDVHLGSDSMIASKDMQDRALDKLTKMLSEPENMKVLKRLKTKEGVAEGWDPDTTRLEQDVRDALENGDDYTAKQYAKMAPTPEAKKYLLNIIKQAMYLDDLGGETDWKGVAEGRKEDEEQYRQQSDQAWDKVYSQAKGPVSRFATKVAAKLDGSKRKLGQNKEQGVAEGTETGPYKVMGGEDGYYIVGPGRKLNSGACYYDSQDAHEACATLNKRYSQQGVAEGDNPEYDDEAGMAESNLHTIARAAQGLIDTIGENENLPEWCQEKIAKVEGMLVAVWDYLESQEEQGIDPQVDEDWQKTNKQDKTDGMSPKAVKAYRRENPGSKLKTAVTTKPSKLKPGSKAAKRRKSFCARMSGNKGPMKDEKGRPTPKAKALRRWNCESVEQTVQMLESVQRDLSEVKQRLDPKCWKGYKKSGTKMKGDTRVNNCVPMEEGEGNFEKALGTLSGSWSGWYPDEGQSDPNVKTYWYDDGEGGHYASGTIEHNLKTGQVTVDYEGEYNDEVKGTFKNMGDAMRALRGGYPGSHGGKAPNFDRLGQRTPYGPDDLRKTDRTGRKGTIGGGYANKLKGSIQANKGRLGPKGVLPESDISEDRLAQDLYRDLQIFKKGADKDIGSKAKDKEISSKAKDKEIQKKK